MRNRFYNAFDHESLGGSRKRDYRIENWAACESPDPERQRWLDRLLTAIRRDRLENVFARKVGAFITACRLRERENFMSARTMS
jgi:dGTPase